MFALTQGNCVACLDGLDGKIVWKSWIPERVHGPVGATFIRARQPVHLLRDGRLLVVDINGVLHVFDPADGNLLDSLALATGFRSDDGGLPSAKIPAPPWLEGNRLIVACQKGLIAYTLDTSQWSE